MQSTNFLRMNSYLNQIFSADDRYAGQKEQSKHLQFNQLRVAYRVIC